MSAGEAMADATGTQRVSDSDYREISEFLFREARLLDAGRYVEWLAFLDPDYVYRLVSPTVTMVRPNEGSPNPEVVLMDENMPSLKARIRQLTTPALTLAENPRPATRRLVGNILVDGLADSTLFRVHSNALIYQSRGMGMAPHVFSTSRTDEIQRTDGSLLLKARAAQLDETVIGARSITGLF